MGGYVSMIDGHIDEVPMNDKEKLMVLLLEHCDYKGQIDCKEDCERCLAEYLIANGVVVREKGEWESVLDKDGKHREEEIYASVWRCPVCGEEDFRSNFCPNCGADMRKGDDKE